MIIENDVDYEVIRKIIDCLCINKKLSKNEELCLNYFVDEIEKYEKIRFPDFGD
jgi:hypothetical protein